MEDKDEKLYEWLDGNELGINIVKKKYLYENETFDEWLNRVSGNDEDVKDLILSKKFLFGGRILANRGLKENGVNGSLSNCYVLTVQDSIESIYQTCAEMARTYSYGGGVGVDISNLRPNGAKVNNSARTTTGAVSFMKTFDTVTGTIGTKGRRGALMLSIDVRHPDVEEFINVKANTTEITNANISIRVNDDFMKTVASNEDYVLRWPCSSDIKFSDEEISQMKYGVLNFRDGIYYKKINSQKLFKQIAKNNWNYGEPGVLFWDTMDKRNMMEMNDEFKYAGTNPCGELPLPDGCACLLGSMNLSAYVDSDGNIMEDEFAKDVRTATKALNAVLDEGIPLHPLEKQRANVAKWRQIGLGLFDLSGELIKMKVKYGSDEAKKIACKMTHLMLINAFEASCDLNVEGFTYPNMFESEFYKTKVLPYIGKKYIGKYPRNCQLLTIAPTGTTSTMINASSGGGEPMFALSYTRTTKSMDDKDTTYKVYPQMVLDYFGGSAENVNTDELPEYFISAEMLDWKDRVDMQASLQKNIDGSISSTVNLKENTTVDDIYNLYMYAWEKGLKGITVFRENCKRSAILSRGEQQQESDFNNTMPPKRPKTLEADFYQVKANGENFCVFVGLYNGKPYELFAVPCESKKVSDHKGKIVKVRKMEYRFESDLLTMENIGDCDREYRNVTLHVSAALRHGMPIKSIVALENKCNDSIVSFNKAVSRVLNKYVPKEVTSEICPWCGQPLIRENGCLKCLCGYSRCE